LFPQNSKAPPANAQGRPNKGNNVTFSPVEDNERGNSREYTVRRLKRDRPDLAEMVIVRAIATPLEAERMHEADNIERIIAEENRRKMLAGKAPDPVATLQQGSAWERKTATQVAEAVGMKPRTFAKVKHIHDTAQDDTLAAPPAPQTPPYAGGVFLCLRGRFLRVRGVLCGLWCNGGRKLV
jgi:hypothetical protein